jgi:hypothetical protein
MDCNILKKNIIGKPRGKIAKAWKILRFRFCCGSNVYDVYINEHDSPMLEI